jgi:hypothetical protein
MIGLAVAVGVAIDHILRRLTLDLLSSDFARSGSLLDHGVQATSRGRCLILLATAVEWGARAGWIMTVTI